MNNEPSGRFDDEEIMIFPESIDDIEPNKTSYLFTTPKLIMMFVGILPLIVLSIMLLSEFGLFPFIVFTVLYLIIYFYFVRLYVIEEPRQRESLNLLEDNKYSDCSFFWDITKVGTDVSDNGLLYMVQDGRALKRAYVVRFDSGSIVGVPSDFLNEFRNTQQEFLRSLGMDFKWYSIQKRPTLNKSLSYQGGNLKNIDNPDLNKLVKMQINTYIRYSMEAEQRYENYIVVINNKFETLSSFRQNLEDILTRTLRTNGAFRNVEILDKDGLDTFFSTYYLQDKLDISSIRKSGITKAFSSYAKIISVVDENGKSVPVELIDEINKMTEPFKHGLTFEKATEIELSKEIRLEELRLRQKEFARQALVRKRRNEEITFEEYKEQLADIETKFSKENFIPNREEVEKQELRNRKRQEKEERREQERLEREEERRRKETPEPKWFEEEYEGNPLSPDFKLEQNNVQSGVNTGQADNIDSILYEDGEMPNQEYDSSETKVVDLEEDLYDILSDDDSE